LNHQWVGATPLTAKFVSRHTSAPGLFDNLFFRIQTFWTADVFFFTRYPATISADELGIANQFLIFFEIGVDIPLFFQVTQRFVENHQRLLLILIEPSDQGKTSGFTIITMLFQSPAQVFQTWLGFEFHLSDFPFL